MRSITGRRLVLLLLGGAALGSHAPAVAQPLTRVPATSLQVGVTFGGGGPGGGGPNLPATLSATGAFSSLQPLIPAPGLVAYEPIGSLWTDHAQKYRWFALRDTASTFGFSADGNWTLPTGAVWIKHFELELTRGDPRTARRIETRFIVRSPNGIQRFTYRWNENQTDAVLVPSEGATQVFNVVENGVSRPQTWRFPSHMECVECHTQVGGLALSFNTRQLNREHRFPGGTANYIVALADAGYLSNVPPLEATDARGRLPQLPALARSDDPMASLETRARSYLDVNCSYCHQPGGPGVARFDARLSTPLALAGLVNGPLLNQAGDPANRVVVPGDLAHSRIWQRITVRGADQMPPLATYERDLAGEALIRAWISALADTAPATPGHLINLAARARVGPGDDAAIVGFVVGPGSGQRVLVRAIGPTLGTPPFNLDGALNDPVLSLFGPDSPTRIAAANDNWAATDAATFASVGAFSLPAGSRDAAIVTHLAPGAYTAQASGTGNPAGVALVEVYSADPTSPASPPSRLVNLSVRANVGTGDSVLIPGLVVSEGSPKRVLVRAVGPTLAAAPFNVAGTLAQPVITLFRGAQAIATNQAWNSAPNATEIRATARTVGAFALLEGSRDSALLIELPAGAYTLQVAGAATTTGIALIEVYEVP
jgi:uncharacterized repeat protein (TIGR03806 family)